jgi:hypothetical protein
LPARATPGTLETIDGDTDLSLWGGHDASVADTAAKVQLRLAPDCPVVIGRQESGLPSYLDPSYRPTRIMPSTGQAIVKSGSGGKDVYVSRAHFMLRGHAGGITLTNGVPKLGGGIRPPTNGTWMWGSNWRRMEPGEEHLIEHGASISLFLPNGTVVRISAG